jgi:mono/diheme cytochrome c family protein
MLAIAARQSGPTPAAGADAVADTASSTPPPIAVDSPSTSVPPTTPPPLTTPPPTPPSTPPQRARADTAPQPGVVSSWSGVFTDAQASTGEKVYMVLCNSCHAPLNNHVGAIFKASWASATAADMMDYLVAEMPKNDPGSLSRPEYASIMAYLFKLNGMPAGNRQLASDAAALRRIRIDTIGR